MGDEEDLLVDRDEYLANGVHIGTKAQHKDMEEYIFHVKKNQLAVLNLEDTDQRIRKAAKMLANYDPEDILVVGRKEEAQLPVRKLSEALGTMKVDGRFMPGTLTNPQSENFVEPELVVITDPETDSQVVQEARDTKIPVIAVADSENSLEDIDLVIPANNKGKNALGMVFYLLAQQYFEQTDEDFDYELSDFQPEQERTEDEDKE
ncbi:MAG: 30S ribosomal protein S2 [Candidatus Nanohalobium sp.]